MQSEQTENIQQWIEDEGYLVNPTLSVLRELADSLSPGEGHVKVLAKYSVIRSIDREYTQASQLAWLEENDVISFREITGEYQSNLVVTDSVTGAFLTLQHLTAAVGTDDADLVAEARSIATDLWADASQISLRTPSHEVVKETFAERLTADVYETFFTIVQAMERAGRTRVEGSGNPFSGGTHTHASLLVAGAVHETVLYQLGKCVEDCRVASRSSLSRVKQDIEDEGFISTTPIKVDVGRPRMRLHVAGLYSGDDLELLSERVYEDLHESPE